MCIRDRHFIDGADGIDKVKPDAFIGPCTVLEVSPGIITGSVVEEYFPRRAERILLKSGGRAFIHRSAADAMAYFGYKLVGTDGLDAVSYTHLDVYKRQL